MAARFNFPLFLTWLRIVAIPLFVAVLYLPESWITERTANITSMWIFIAAAVTDWLDGYLARRWNQTTSFGAFLDPVADKLMVAAALIVLTEKGIVDPFASLIIIGREITISALREWMAQIGQSKSVAVNILGKVKTVSQLIAIPFLLFNGVLFGLFHTVGVGRALIWVAAIITLLSMGVYLKAAMASPPPESHRRRSTDK
ncbi:MAG TPA: CDP-diacylglycerol--glycerol-3-phosphate 3-phosphatidyltransferase [Usitatibacter sp.]|nr:CDP-diacylglycerol--glycerol-3-phosphate 3-phosphatidyltransferase [Usitatibacter sp.]